ncbi:helix-turn-helix domain-containing protein [Bacillus alkalicellulosilyticus]|uniref:AlbA family DNA-binding domain-containing protein n=1 Tax=Alkalihalobacterium alkalicellulosilyticum TaxID=1912214 RepID=UPI001FEC6B08|nr:ATP-binding protein [Bacillus alkalicellulosilyticus]
METTFLIDCIVKGVNDASNIEEEIYKLISKKTEGDYWDFKQEWHKDSERLLHDILCFANTVHDRDCNIIIGVSDDGEIIGLNDENRVKQAGILDLLSNTVFAGDKTPAIKVETCKIEDMEIDILTVFNSYSVPFYLKKKSKRYSNIKEGYIYTRIGDKNTPINQNANMQQIEMLWKKRLGLTQPPLRQIVNRLKNKSEWVKNNGTHFNIYKPEFKLVEEYEDDAYDRRTGEFYVYSQTNSKYSYKYYLKDSIAYELQEFFFDDEDMEEVYAKKTLMKLFYILRIRKKRYHLSLMLNVT